jgi:hypothetical protein
LYEKTTDLDLMSFDYTKEGSMSTMFAEEAMGDPTFRAVADYVETRVVRRVTSKVATVGLGAFSAVSRVKWIKYVARGGVRFIPVIGYGMLAYDLYNLGEELEMY